MGRSLVMRMVRRVLHGLDVDQAAEQEQAEAQPDRDGSLGGCGSSRNSLNHTRW